MTLACHSSLELERADHVSDVQHYTCSMVLYGADQHSFYTCSRVFHAMNVFNYQ